MDLAQIEALNNGDVVFADYPNDDPNEPNEFTPRRVLILDKFSSTWAKVICITDIENISTQRGVPIYKDSREAFSMGLVKDSFIKVDDCKSIPTKSFKKYKGTCPTHIFQRVLAFNPY